MTPEREAAIRELESMIELLKEQREAIRKDLAAHKTEPTPA